MHQFSKEQCYEILAALEDAIRMAAEHEAFELAERFAGAKGIVLDEVFGWLPEGE